MITAKFKHDVLDLFNDELHSIGQVLFDHILQFLVELRTNVIDFACEVCIMAKVVSVRRQHYVLL